VTFSDQFDERVTLTKGSLATIVYLAIKKAQKGGGRFSHSVLDPGEGEPLGWVFEVESRGNNRYGLSGMWEMLGG